MKKKVLILSAMALAMVMTIASTDSKANNDATAMFLSEDNVAIAESSGSCVYNTWTLCWRSNGSVEYTKKWKSS
ncbi:MAG: hypothetical protein AAFZ63_12760 [Bacteroidota bacterium]